MQITVCDYCKRNLTEDKIYYNFTVDYGIFRKDPKQKNNDFVTKSRDACKACFEKIMNNVKLPFEE